MKSSTKSALLAMTTVFLWSSAFPITKIAAQAFTPNALGLFRCTLTAGILLGIGWKNHLSKPKKPAHILLFLLSGGLGFTLYMLFFNTGMLTLNSAVASLIIATTPVLTAAGASVLYHEKIRPAAWSSSPAWWFSAEKAAESAGCRSADRPAPSASTLGGRHRHTTSAPLGASTADAPPPAFPSVCPRR